MPAVNANAPFEFRPLRRLAAPVAGAWLLAAVAVSAGDAIIFTEPGKSAAVPQAESIDTGADAGIGRIKMGGAMDLGAPAYVLASPVPARRARKADASDNFGLGNPDAPKGFDANNPFADNSPDGLNNGQDKSDYALDSFFRSRDRKKTALSRETQDSDPNRLGMVGAADPKDPLDARRNVDGIATGDTSKDKPGADLDRANRDDRSLDPRNRTPFGVPPAGAFGSPQGVADGSRSLGDSLMKYQEQKMQDARMNESLAAFRRMLDNPGGGLPQRNDFITLPGDLTRQSAEPVIARPPDSLGLGQNRDAQNLFGLPNSAGGLGALNGDNGARPFGGLSLPGSAASQPEAKRFEGSPAILQMPRRQF